MSAKLKPRIIKSDTQYIYIPAGCRERFLTSPSLLQPYLASQDIEWAGISKLTAGYRVDRRHLRTHLILYTMKGSSVLQVKNKPARRLKQGDVFIAPAGNDYSYWTEGRWDIAWIHFSIKSKWDRLFGSEPRACKAAWGGELALEMEGYLREANRRRTDSTVALHSYVNLIVLSLQRELEEKNSNMAAVRRTLEGVWNEVQQHINRKWEVADLATLANMSRSRFYRIVTEQTGFTPMQMIHSMRMEHASVLLLYTDYTLDAIAESVGYEDLFSFSKAFKRHAGVSPGQFRKSRLL